MDGEGVRSAGVEIGSDGETRGAGAAWRAPDGLSGREPLGILIRRHVVAIGVSTGVLVMLGALAGSGPWLTAALVLASAPVAACVVIDARTHRIPTPLVRMIATVGAATFLTGAVATGAWSDLGRAAGSASVVGGAFLAVWWCTRGSLGLGDVRLAAALALFTGWLGWRATGGFVLAAYLVAFPVALVRYGRGRRDPMPFGPALVAGWYVMLGAAAWGGVLG